VRKEEKTGNMIQKEKWEVGAEELKNAVRVEFF
jgi:hypothetical protein